MGLRLHLGDATFEYVILAPNTDVKEVVHVTVIRLSSWLKSAEQHGRAKPLFVCITGNMGIVKYWLCSLAALNRSQGVSFAATLCWEN